MNAINRQAPTAWFMTALLGTAALCVVLGGWAVFRLGGQRATYLLVGRCPVPGADPAHGHVSRAAQQRAAAGRPGRARRRRRAGGGTCGTGRGGTTCERRCVSPPAQSSRSGCASAEPARPQPSSSKSVSWRSPGAASREFSESQGVRVGAAMRSAPAPTSRSVVTATSETSNATRRCGLTGRPTSTCVDEVNLRGVRDLQRGAAGVEDHHACAALALQIQLDGQSQRVAIERHGLVEITGVDDETQLTNSLDGWAVGFGGGHRHIVAARCPQRLSSGVASLLAST